MNELSSTTPIGEPPPLQVTAHAGIILTGEEYGERKAFRLELTCAVTAFLRGRAADIV